MESLVWRESVDAEGAESFNELIELSVVLSPSEGSEEHREDGDQEVSLLKELEGEVHASALQEEVEKRIQLVRILFNEILAAEADLHSKVEFVHIENAALQQTVEHEQQTRSPPVSLALLLWKAAFDELVEQSVRIECSLRERQWHLLSSEYVNQHLLPLME